MFNNKILKSTVCGLLLFCAVMLAQNYEVINFTDNWGKDPLFNVAYSSNSELEIVFSIHQLVVSETEIDGVRMKTYGMPGVFLPNDEGAPNLGGVSRFIAIPQGATAQATIVDFRTEVYHNIEVAPAPNIPLETDKSPLRYVKNMEIYGRNEYYPSSPVKLSEPMQLRGVDCVILGITPFQYNPITKDLIVYKDIRVRIDFIGGNGHFGVDELRNIYWEPILQAHLLNYSALPKIDFFAPERIRARDGYEYIIIVPDDPVFIAWAETIKVWRKLQGISTNVYTLTQVGGNTATAIENFLNNAYNTWNPRPIGFLLLSDYPSSGDIYGITSPTWNSYCISDNMYADVNGDNLPDMFHGRITAQNESQLSICLLYTS
ncbi:MAG: C25 family cysteine peptidase, partial [candidate division WOR-3 bacterium]|nr:C25 family cysteine peptidase [candidate division WOR-3 bacterium]